MGILIVNDDDLIRRVRPADGEIRWDFYGTTGNDTIQLNLSDPTKKISVFGGPGRDTIFTTPGGEFRELSIYGDNGLRASEFGERVIGDRLAAGNDRIAVAGGNFIIKSGGGQDVYEFHDVGSSYRGALPNLFLNIRADDVIAPGNRGFEVDAFDFTFIEERGDRRIGHIETVEIRFKDSRDLLNGMAAEFEIGVERDGPRADFTVEWRGGSGGGDRAEVAIEAFIQSGVGNAPSDWLHIA